jgi:UDP:flavonoid glycosyltransferase YjiC (YdhE family)
MTQKKILLATLGSLGDLHPFMALSLSLRARGARPVLATAEEYRDKVTAAGIEFAPLRPSFADIETDLGMTRAELTARCVASQEFLVRKLVLPYVRRAYQDADALSADAYLLVTSSLAIGARLAAEKRGIPWIGVVLQPMMFLSAYDPPVIPKAEFVTGLLRRLGPAPTRLLFELGKRATLGMFASVTRLRAEVGLPPSRLHPLFEGQFSSAGALGLYSDVLGGAQPDYPPQTRITGFAPYDSADGHDSKLEPKLAAFLDSGPPPLVFTLGSLIVNNPGSFYRESVLAARRLQRRAVLLVGERVAPNATPPADAYATARPDGAPNAQLDGAIANDPNICVAAYAPHSLLFPRAAAVVHQGGIGTLAQGLRSGRPQLVVPFFADQQDNAARAVRIGLARSLAPTRYTASSAAAELASLLTNPAYAARATAIGSRLAGEDGAAVAADFVLNAVRTQAYRRL